MIAPAMPYDNHDKPDKSDMRPDDTYVARILVNVPAELRQHPAWVCWKWEVPAPRKAAKATKGAQETPDATPSPVSAPSSTPAKLTKVLYNPRTGKRAKTDDARTWAAFDTALGAYQRGGYAGLGYVLTEGADLVVIDLDGCRDADTGALTEQARAIVDRMATYTEVSPSGTGLHLWLSATLPDKLHSRSGKIEIYASGRYLTVTGERLPDASSGIEERGRQIAAFYAETFPAKPARTTPARQPGQPSPAASPDLAASGVSGVSGAPGASDTDILKRARSDGKFQALWNGDTSAYGNDASRADMALIGRLRFYTRGDTGAMDRLFRQSGLYRPEKWDTRHYSTGETYGEHTISEALTGPYEVYSARHRRMSAATLARLDTTPAHDSAPVAQVAPAYLPEPASGPDVYERQPGHDGGNGNGNGNGGAGAMRAPALVELLPDEGVWCDGERTQLYRMKRGKADVDEDGGPLLAPVRFLAGMPRLLAAFCVGGETDGDATEQTTYRYEWSNLPERGPVMTTEKDLNSGAVHARTPGVTITSRRDRDFWADVIKAQVIAFHIPVGVAQQQTGWHQNEASGLWEYHLRDGRIIQRPDAPAVPIAGLRFDGIHRQAWEASMADLPDEAPNVDALAALRAFVQQSDPLGRLLIEMGAAMRGTIATFSPVATAVLPVGQSRAGKTTSANFVRGHDGPCPPRARADCVFTGTIPGLESSIAPLHDVFVLIDDFHIKATDGPAETAKLGNQLDMLITGGADGNDMRPRATRTGKRRKESTITAMMGLTGEGLPATTESRILRAIILPYARGEMDTAYFLSGWEQHQEILTRAGHAVACWVGVRVNDDLGAFRHEIEQQEADYKAEILGQLQAQCPTVDREALDTLASNYARPALGLWLVAQACDPADSAGLVAALFPDLIRYAVLQARSVEMGGPGQASRQWILDAMRAIVTEGHAHGLDMMNKAILDEDVTASLADYGYQGPFARGAHLFNRDKPSGMTYWRTDRLCAALADRASRARPQPLPWPWNAQTLPGYLVKLGIVAPEIDERGAVKRVAQRPYIAGTQVRRLAIPEWLFIGDEDADESDDDTPIPPSDNTPPSSKNAIGDVKNSGLSGLSGLNDPSGRIIPGADYKTAQDRSQNGSGLSGLIRSPGIADGVDNAPASDVAASPEYNGATGATGAALALICPRCGDCQYCDYGDGPRCPICDVPMMGTDVSDAPDAPAQESIASGATSTAPASEDKQQQQPREKRVRRGV